MNHHRPANVTDVASQVVSVSNRLDVVLTARIDRRPPVHSNSSWKALIVIHSSQHFRRHLSHRFAQRLLLLLVACCGFSVTVTAQELDLVISGARVIDGTGAPWFRADIGIRNGLITAIGRLQGRPARRIVDATDLVLAPGFLDMMGQTASPLMTQPAAATNLISQGITTINAGEGVSAAPLNDAQAGSRKWRTMHEYFRQLESAGMPINVVQTVGHTQVRKLVLGEVDRRPTPQEMQRMEDLVRESMRAGAIGFSTALIYPPATYATTEEIAGLAQIAGESGGRYYTHMRNEGDRLLEAIDEALAIGEQAGTPVHIFHLKAAGRQNWAKMSLAIARIKAARFAGQSVTADIYPYINNGLGIAAFIHPRHFTEGRDRLRRRLDDPALRKTIRREMETQPGWENWYRHVGFNWDKVVVGGMTLKPFADHNGKSLAAVAQATQRDPWDLFFELVKSGAFALPESMTESNKRLAMRQEFISFCTDVGPAGGSRVAAHPRAYGAFPRILGRYVRDWGVLSLESAIRRMTANAANQLMIYDRGRIAIGLAADLVLFDAQRVIDRALLAAPHRQSTGITLVIVNGQIVWEQGQYTGRKPGRVLRGPGYRSSDK